MTPAYPNCISVPFPVEILVSEEEMKRVSEWCDDYFRQRGHALAVARTREIDRQIIEILTKK